MPLAAKGPKLFTCPRCRKAYLGHDPLPDCPSCGYDYRVKGGFRWDVLVYLLSVLGLISYLLVSSSYRTLITAPLSVDPPSATTAPAAPVSGDEKLPGSRHAPFVYPSEPAANR
ncbi:MAG TPA: hypothetical protein VJR69_15040 [Nitrospira sp.]|nr:hypothetical protein [Nitrospira sp.]